MGKKINLSGPMIIPLLAAIIVASLGFLLVRNIDAFSPDVSNSIRMYDNSVKYTPGAVVFFNGKLYEMVEGSGSAGYIPDKQDEEYWKPLYDNNVTYQVGAIVRYKGMTYRMIEAAGASGNPPDHPGKKFWAPVYNKSEIYRVGDVISFKGTLYKMVEAAGAAGYTPDRPNDRLWQKA
jgi:hypothetical protein